MEKPDVFYVERSMAGVEAGDLVLIGKNEARRHSPLSLRTVEMLMEAGVLTPYGLHKAIETLSPAPPPSKAGGKVRGPLTLLR